MPRNRKCRDAATNLPGGLSIESFVEAGADDCVVKANELATHVIQIQNRLLIRFKIDIISQCEAESISYPVGERTWMKKVQVGDRPAKGGAYMRKVTENLVCNDTSTDESITVSVKYEAIGCRCFGSAKLELLVDTKK